MWPAKSALRVANLVAGALAEASGRIGAEATWPRRSGGSGGSRGRSWPRRSLGGRCEGHLARTMCPGVRARCTWARRSAGAFARGTWRGRCARVSARGALGPDEVRGRSRGAPGAGREGVRGARGARRREPDTRARGVRAGGTWPRRCGGGVLAGALGPDDVGGRGARGARARAEGAVVGAARTPFRRGWLWAIVPA